MGQVLGFAHCKEAPSTASTTPDSTDGGSEDSEFPALPVPEPPEEEEEDEDEARAAPKPPRGPPRDPPRELTFSYIAFRGRGAAPPCPNRDPGAAPGDPRRGRAPRLSSPRGPDPRAAPRAPQKRPGEPPAPPEGALPDLGGAEVEEPPPQERGSPRAPPCPAARGRHVPAPPEPPQASAPPPPPPGPIVWDLLYWRAPERSALALLVSLVVLGCLSRFSAISVGAYAALAVLAVTVPLRLRQLALRALSPPPSEPPARAVPGGLSPEQQQRWARSLARHAVTATRTLTRLFLVHSVPESLKFAFLFYLLTYVGAACNGLTLLTAGVVCAFTFPVLYRRHQAQIDQYLSQVRSHLSHLRARVLAKLPSAKVKPQ
ncbi:LOW QUALITY PROTEIN: reticulon-2 [Acridotheres tristis]